MNIESLIRKAATEPIMALPKADVESASEEEKKSIDEICNAFARIVAERFLTGEYSWRYCDAAMNSLFGYGYAGYGIPEDALTGLPPFAFDIYIAFDEGEFRHKTKYNEQGEALSRLLVADVLKKYA